MLKAAVPVGVTDRMIDKDCSRDEEMVDSTRCGAAATSPEKSDAIVPKPSPVRHKPIPSFPARDLVPEVWATLKGRNDAAVLSEEGIGAAKEIIKKSDEFSRRAIDFVKLFFKNQGDLNSVPVSASVQEPRFHMRRLGGARVFLDKNYDNTVYIVACDKDEEDYQRISGRLHEMRDIANAGSPCQAHTVVVDTFGCTFFISEISKEKLYAASMAPVEKEPEIPPRLIELFCEFLLHKNCDSFAQLITGTMKLLGFPLKSLKSIATEVKRQDPTSAFVPILEDEVFLNAASDILSRNLRFVSLQSETKKREVIAKFLSILTLKSEELHEKMWKEIARNSCEGCSFSKMFSNIKRSVGLVEALMSKQKIIFREGIIRRRIENKSPFEPNDITDFRFNVQELALISRARGLVHEFNALHSSDKKVKLQNQYRAVGALFQAFETYALNNSHFLECERALNQLYQITRTKFDEQRFREFSSLRFFSK